VVVVDPGWIVVLVEVVPIPVLVVVLPPGFVVEVVVVLPPGFVVEVVVVLPPGFVVEVVVVLPPGFVVEVDVEVVVVTRHAEASMVFLSSVTAPFCARARPSKLAPVPRLMSVSARILPMNVAPEPIVAELATFHHTLQDEPIPLRN